MRIGVDARNLVPNVSGIGRYVLEMCRVLVEQGHSLVLYLPEAPCNGLPPMPGCELRIWNAKGPWRRVAWSMTVLPKVANEDNLDVFWGPAHRLPPGLYPSLPRVVTIHDMVWRKAGYTMRCQTWLGERLFMRSAIKQADAVIAVSHATAADVIEFYADAADRTRVIYSGVTHLPPPEGSWPNSVGDDVRQNYALFVGTLEPRKNLRRLLEAFAMLTAAERSGLKLVIAGGHGWGMEDLVALIAREGLQEIVALAGYVSDSELAQLYASARMLLMPSLYEGFGLPIIEAQSLGVPVITSNRSSMSEIAAKGALLVDPENVADIAAAISLLSLDKNVRMTLARGAEVNARRFSWERAGSELGTVFEKLLNNP